jgi:transposase InsO family protein
MDADIERTVKQCHSCTVVGRPATPVPVKRTPLPQGPWQYLAIDYQGPLPSNKYLLVIVDYFSRYKEVFITKNILLRATILMLKEVFVRFGFPFQVKSDNGTNLTSKEVRKFYKEYGIEPITTPPLWAQANGEVERQNESLLKRMKIASLERKNLQEELLNYLLLYRTTPHSVTGISPCRLLLKREIRDKLPSLQHSLDPDDSEFRDRDTVKKQLGKEYSDHRTRAKEQSWVIGDYALLPAKKENKLSPTFHPTPRKVLEVTPHEVVVDVEGTPMRRSISAIKKVDTPEIMKEDAEISPSPLPNSSSDLSPSSKLSDSSSSSNVSTPVLELRRSTRVWKPVERLNI